MKIKLLKKFHKQWRHKITEDGHVVIIDDLKNIGIEYNSIYEFMEQYLVWEYFALNTFCDWVQKKKQIINKNNEKEIYNKNK